MGVNPYYPLLISISGYSFTKIRYSPPAVAMMQESLMQMYNHISYI